MHGNIPGATRLTRCAATRANWGWHDDARRDLSRRSQPIWCAGYGWQRVGMDSTRDGSGDYWLRGGSWGNDPYRARVAARVGRIPASRATSRVSGRRPRYFWFLNSVFLVSDRRATARRGEDFWTSDENIPPNLPKNLRLGESVPGLAALLTQPVPACVRDDQRRDRALAWWVAEERILLGVNDGSGAHISCRPGVRFLNPWPGRP